MWGGCDMWIVRRRKVCKLKCGMTMFMTEKG